MHEIELADSDLERLESVFTMLNDSGAVKRYLGRKTHIFPCIPPNPSEASKVETVQKQLIHMNYNYCVSTIEIGDILTIEYNVYVEMADGSKPPYAKTTLRKEFLNLQLPSPDNRQVVESIVPINAGPNKGKYTITFTNKASFTNYVSLFKTYPAPLIYQFLL